MPGEINADNRHLDLAALPFSESEVPFTFLCLGKVDLKSCDFGPLPSPTAKITGDKNCESIQFDPESDSNWICSRVEDQVSLVPVVLCSPSCLGSHLGEVEPVGNKFGHLGPQVQGRRISVSIGRVDPRSSLAVRRNLQTCRLSAEYQHNWTGTGERFAPEVGPPRVLKGSWQEEARDAVAPPKPLAEPELDKNLTKKPKWSQQILLQAQACRTTCCCPGDRNKEF